MMDPGAYLRSLISKNSKDEALVKLLEEAEGYYEKRLWHQLTLILNDRFVSDQNVLRKLGGKDLYDQFIADFETRLNPLSLVNICSPMWELMSDKNEVLNFMLKISEKVKNHQEAFCLSKVWVGNLHLEYFKKPDVTKKIIEEVDELLDGVKGVGKVHAKFYSLASEFYKQQGDHEKYYKSSLKYLGCTDISELSLQTRRVLAGHLSLAAILGNNIYNFGELLSHKVLESLKGSEDEWLVDLLYAFNSGDVVKYNKFKPRWSAIADLNSNQEIMFEKLCLLALMEMAFQRRSQERVLSFEEIAKVTDLPVNQIEILVMKALAKGLVKGHIDQVDSNVVLTWVQPRVLDTAQLQTISDKINVWSKSISSLEDIVEQNAGEILTV